MPLWGCGEEGGIPMLRNTVRDLTTTKARWRGKIVGAFQDTRVMTRQFGDPPAAYAAFQYLNGDITITARCEPSAVRGSSSRSVLGAIPTVRFLRMGCANASLEADAICSRKLFPRRRRYALSK